MPKLTVEQIFECLTYRKTILDLITQESFLECFEDLKLITRDVIISIFSTGASTPSFESCSDVYEYVNRLEKSLGFSGMKWQLNISKLNQFFSAVLNTGQFDILKLGFTNLNKELSGLANGEQLYMPSIDLDELSDLPVLSVNQQKTLLYTDTPSVPKPTETIAYTPLVKNIHIPTAANRSEVALDLNRCYDINKEGFRGICLIINIYRNYSIYDVDIGVKVFQQLNYKVITFDNITARSFMTSLKGIRKQIESLNSDSFILIFSSHGDPNSVMFSDDKRIPRENIILEFLPTYCPSLADKPKLFFFQNCRGSNTFENEDISDTDSVMHSDAVDAENVKIVESIKTGLHLPTDIMRFYASTEGSVAYRLSTGSIFLQALYEILEDETINRESLNELQSDLVRRVTRYSQETLQKSNRTGGQVPEFKSSLVKKYYFKHPYL